MNEIRIDNYNPVEYRFIIGQITRQQTFISYWVTNLAEVCQKPYFNREVKKMYNQVILETTNYENSVRSKFSSEDEYEKMLDSCVEFRKSLEDTLFYYEQYIARIIEKNKIEDSNWMCKLYTSKDMLDLCGNISGLECYIAPRISHLAKLGGTVCEMPYYVHNKNRMLPTVSGHFARLCGRMNKLILNRIGIKQDICFVLKEGSEQQRTFEHIGNKLIASCTNYELIHALNEDNGHTLDDARKISEKRIKENNLDELIRLEKQKLKQQNNGN